MPAYAGFQGLQQRYKVTTPPPVDAVEAAYRSGDYSVSLSTFRTWVELSQASCAPRSAPTSIGLAIGAENFEDDRIALGGIHTLGDMAYMASMYTRKGVADVRELADPTQEQMAASLTQALADSRCGDRLFVSYSGSGIQVEGPRGLTSVLMAADTDADCLLPSQCSTPRTLTSDDLAAFVSTARNRGVTPVLFVDSCHGTDVSAHSAEAVWTLGGTDPDPMRIHSGAADFAAFFAAGPSSVAMELPGPEGMGGAFTFGLAQALRSDEAPSARSVGDSVLAFLKQAAPQQQPLIQASDPDLPLFGTRPAPSRGLAELADKASLALSGDRLSKLKTGALVLRAPRDEMVTLTGRVRPSQGLHHVRIGAHVVRPDRRGAFRAEVRTPEGGEPLLVHAVFDDHSLVTQTVDVIPEGVMVEEIVKGEQYALLLGVQNYASDEIRDLSTPHADIHAVSEMLSSKFGFSTSIHDEAGVAHSLVLEDPTRHQILQALERLVLSTTADDRVLVYYAGHSEIPEGLDEAYWLPADADRRFTTDWVSADRVRAAIKRMPAHSVLVVSDSCYSAKLTRALDPREERVPLDERSASLVRLSQSRSRLLISSGANEPVLDGGGDGHSVFARAFMNGLKEQPQSAFTTTELFTPLRERVVGQSGQEPQRLVYQGSGHDAGDFVFVAH